MASAAFADGHETYPNRPIMMMISYGAGGATDYQARIVTRKAGDLDAIGMPIAIINKPGDGGRVGWNWLANQADRDGYTAGVYNLPHFIAQSIVGGVDYSVDSFEPIANWGADPAVFVVPQNSQFNTMQQVVDFARANPGVMTVSGAGRFVGHHIAALQLAQAAGVELAFIPDKSGGAGALKSVIAGHTLGGVNNLSDAFRARAAGKVKILGLFDLARNPLAADVPTLMELGYDVDDASVNYRGVMVPKGTPQAVIDRLSREIPSLFNDPSVAQAMQAGGAPMRVLNRQEVLELWRAQESALKKLLAGLAP
jgi:tripartite-type tricarboxylate transporter receptor subunit TctC